MKLEKKGFRNITISFYSIFFFQKDYGLIPII